MYLLQPFWHRSLLEGLVKLKKIREKIGWPEPIHPPPYPFFIYFLQTFTKNKTKQKHTHTHRKNPNWGLTDPPTSEFFSDFLILI